MASIAIQLHASIIHHVEYYMAEVIGGLVQYYFSPTGKKYRSRLEVGKALGIEADNRKDKRVQKSDSTQTARSDALIRVRESAAALNSSLPLNLGKGLSILRYSNTCMHAPLLLTC